MKYCEDCQDMEKCEMYGGCWNPPAKEKPLYPSKVTDCSALRMVACRIEGCGEIEHGVFADTFRKHSPQNAEHMDPPTQDSAPTEKP